jgi:hypothetical protein
VTETTVHLPDDPADFGLADWLSTGTVARQHVTIYADQAAASRLEEIDARLREIDPDVDPAAGGDGPLSAAGKAPVEVAELEAEAAELIERMQASRAVWEVRALSGEEVQVARDAVKWPRPPVQPPAAAGERAQERFRDAVIAYSAAQDAADLEFRCRIVHTAVVAIVTPRGTVDAISLDSVTGLRAKPHGQAWLDRLYKAVDSATEEDVEIPRPTWPGHSTAARG